MSMADAVRELRLQVESLQAENKTVTSENARLEKLCRKLEHLLMDWKANITAALGAKEELSEPDRAFHAIRDALVQARTTKNPDYRLQETVNAINTWSDTYGADLCPENYGSTDSFGEGMRAAKRRVKDILLANTRLVGNSPTGLTCSDVGCDCVNKMSKEDLVASNVRLIEQVSMPEKQQNAELLETVKSLQADKKALGDRCHELTAEINSWQSCVNGVLGRASGVSKPHEAFRAIKSALEQTAAAQVNLLEKQYTYLSEMTERFRVGGKNAAKQHDTLKNLISGLLQGNWDENWPINVLHREIVKACRSNKYDSYGFVSPAEDPSKKPLAANEGTVADHPLVGYSAERSISGEGRNIVICDRQQRTASPDDLPDWHKVSDDTAFARPFATIRVCRGCGCLVAGGPTCCGRCAAAEE